MSLVGLRSTFACLLGAISMHAVRSQLKRSSDCGFIRASLRDIKAPYLFVLAFGAFNGIALIAPTRS